MKTKLFLILGIAVVSGSIFGLFVASRFTASSDYMASWNDYEEAIKLVHDSKQIILATYIDETVHKIPVISPVDGKEHGSVTEIYRKFRVTELLKGGATAGDTIYIVWTAGFTGERLKSNDPVLKEYELLRLAPKQEYALFLEGTVRPDGYPTQYGDVVWSITGSPGVARIAEDGDLKFEATERYKNSVDEKGLDRPEDSAAPFVLTKEELKEIISNNTVR